MGNFFFFFQEREACPYCKPSLLAGACKGGALGGPRRRTVSFAEHLLLSSQTSHNPATLTGTTSSCKEKRVETQQLSGRPIYIQAASVE